MPVNVAVSPLTVTIVRGVVTVIGDVWTVPWPTEVSGKFLAPPGENLTLARRFARYSQGNIA